LGVNTTVFECFILMLVQAHYVARHILSFAWGLINEFCLKKSVSLQLVSKIDEFVLGLKSVGKLYLTPCSADTSRLLTGKICMDNYILLPNNPAHGSNIVTYLHQQRRLWLLCMLDRMCIVHGAFYMCKHAIPLPNKYWVDYRSSCIYYTNYSSFLWKIYRNLVKNFKNHQFRESTF
jgi:hypothetical protein